MDGNKEDWINLKKKVETLFKDRVDKEWANKWEKPLFDILDRFIGAYDGEIDCLFWNSMVRRGRAVSGRMYPNDDPSNINSYYGGWVNILFPYLNQMQSMGKLGKQVDEANSLKGGNGAHNDPDGSSAFQENYGFDTLYKIDQYFANKSRRRGGGGNGDPLKKVLRPTSSLKVFPIGLANAPVIYQDMKDKKRYQLKFASGFIGVEQNEKTLEVCPKIGWFIAEK